MHRICLMDYYFYRVQLGLTMKQNSPSINHSKVQILLILEFLTCLAVINVV